MRFMSNRFGFLLWLLTALVCWHAFVYLLWEAGYFSEEKGWEIAVVGSLIVGSSMFFGNIWLIGSEPFQDDD